MTDGQILRLIIKAYEANGRTGALVVFSEVICRTDGKRASAGNDHG
jgi:hypothetical protein